MGEVLGLGLTHQPSLCARELRPGSFKRAMADPGLAPELRDPANWPAQLRKEWSDDEGGAAGVTHRDELIEEFRLLRSTLDRFDPDVVLIWGDDQYERLTEECIPPFCIVAQDEFVLDPWQHFTKPNVWAEPAEATFRIPGNRGAAKAVVSGLLDRNIDMSYSYASGRGLGHAFINTVLYLDWDRHGFAYPIIPCTVNCYGSLLVAAGGDRLGLSNGVPEEDLDPPSPTPGRCFDVGAAIAGVVRETDLRVALIASSSWSHAFLTRKHSYLYPDTEADLALFDAFERGDYEAWRQTDRKTVEASGQHEMLNWFCLAGAVSALGLRPTHLRYVRSQLFNSGKAFAIFESRAREGRDSTS
jgi:hypothetical protein